MQYISLLPQILWAAICNCPNDHVHKQTNVFSEVSSKNYFFIWSSLKSRVPVPQFSQAKRCKSFYSITENQGGEKGHDSWAGVMAQQTKVLFL